MVVSMGLAGQLATLREGQSGSVVRLRVGWALWWEGLEVGVTQRPVGQLQGSWGFHGLGQGVGLIFLPTFFLPDHTPLCRVLLGSCQHQSDDSQ